jgi:hypothetical protein
MKITLDNGKYEVVLSENGSSFEALRYGELWRDLVGDNLIYYMFLKIVEQEEEIRRLRWKI